jgi:uncharacterized membrane protein
LSEPFSPTPKIKLRIENLSDLVFGLALSIGSIVLISKLPQTDFGLVSGVVLFGFSFLIVVWIWTGYTTTMAYLPFEVRGAFLLNIALLFCVAIEPYLFYVVTQEEPPLLEFSSSVYGLDVGTMIFMLAGLTYILLQEEKKGNLHNLPHARLRRFRVLTQYQVAGGLLFVVSALPFFWIPVPVSLGSFLRFDMWYAALVVLFVGPRLWKRVET